MKKQKQNKIFLGFFVLTAMQTILGALRSVREGRRTRQPLLGRWSWRVGNWVRVVKIRAVELIVKPSIPSTVLAGLWGAHIKLLCYKFRINKKKKSGSVWYSVWAVSFGNPSLGTQDYTHAGQVYLNLSVVLI